MAWYLSKITQVPLSFELGYVDDEPIRSVRFALAKDWQWVVFSEVLGVLAFGAARLLGGFDDLLRRAAVYTAGASGLFTVLALVSTATLS